MPAPTTAFRPGAMQARPAAQALCVSLALWLSGCGDATQAPSGDGAAREARLREIEDASDAIERLIQARRTREAELLVRKLVAAVPAERRESRLAELAARTLFARAQLDAAELAKAERAELVREAAAFAREAARAAPDAVRLRFAALLAGQSGDTIGARDLYDEALAFAPDDLQALLFAAGASLAARDAAHARPLVARHAALAPEDPWSAALEAQLALLDGDTKRAVERATEAVARDRELLEVRLVLSAALLADARASDAARLLAALPAETRAKVPVADALARALVASGDLRAAAQAWDDARRANPTDAFVRAEAAIALLRAGEHTRAASLLDGFESLVDGMRERARVEEAVRAAPQAP
ncbi:MAG: hypothetical protein GC172_12450 [Phycisphaera sp.]|nr:hypothetical protein [Phycisphaera sp.]